MSSFPKPVVKEVDNFSPINSFVTFIKEYLPRDLCVYILILIHSVYIFAKLCFICCSDALVNFKNSYCVSLQNYSVISMAFPTQGPFMISSKINLRFDFFQFCERIHWTFDGNQIQSVHKFFVRFEIAIFTVLILLIHVFKSSFHLLISCSIIFFIVLKYFKDYFTVIYLCTHACMCLQTHVIAQRLWRLEEVVRIHRNGDNEIKVFMSLLVQVIGTMFQSSEKKAITIRGRGISPYP